jgi:hypothetical protein
MICFNSGCSFTTPGPQIAQEEMYWYLLAQDLGCTKIINESRPGSSNDLIIRRVYKHAIENPDSDTFYIINLTSLNRCEISQDQSEKLQEILTPVALARYDFETVELTAYAQIIGLVSFLNQYQKNFYIINNSKCFTDGNWGPRDAFMKFVNNESRILNLYQWAKYDFHQFHSKIRPYDYEDYGWNGHDGPAGHRAYYNKLRELIDVQSAKKQLLEGTKSNL